MSTPEGPPPGGQQPPQQPPMGGGYPQGQPPYGPGPGYGQPPQGPGMQERAAHAVEAVGRHVKTPETKEFFKTSEFAVWLLTAAGILIAGAVIGGGDDDEFPANLVWTLLTALSFAYIISRGISKAGTRRGYGDAPMDRGYGGGGGY